MQQFYNGVFTITLIAIPFILGWCCHWLVLWFRKDVESLDKNIKEVKKTKEIFKPEFPNMDNLAKWKEINAERFKGAKPVSTKSKVEQLRLYFVVGERNIAPILDEILIKAWISTLIDSVRDKSFPLLGSNKHKYIDDIYCDLLETFPLLWGDKHIPNSDKRYSLDGFYLTKKEVCQSLIDYIETRF